MQVGHDAVLPEEGVGDVVCGGPAFANHLAPGIDGRGCAEDAAQGPQIGHEAPGPEKGVGFARRVLALADYLALGVDAERSAERPAQGPQLRHGAAVPDDRADIHQGTVAVYGHPPAPLTDDPSRRADVHGLAELLIESAQVDRGIGTCRGPGQARTTGGIGRGFLGRARGHRKCQSGAERGYPPAGIAAAACLPAFGTLVDGARAKEGIRHMSLLRALAGFIRVAVILRELVQATLKW